MACCRHRCRWFLRMSCAAACLCLLLLTMRVGQVPQSPSQGLTWNDQHGQRMILDAPTVKLYVAADSELSELSLLPCCRNLAPMMYIHRLVWERGVRLVSRCQTLVASPLSLTVWPRVHTVSDNGLATRVWQRETRVRLSVL